LLPYVLLYLNWSSALLRFVDSLRGIVCRVSLHWRKPKRPKYLPGHSAKKWLQSSSSCIHGFSELFFMMLSCCCFHVAFELATTPVNQSTGCAYCTGEYKCRVFSASTSPLYF
jgi:hypothetical protein